MLQSNLIIMIFIPVSALLLSLYQIKASENDDDACVNDLEKISEEDRIAKNKDRPL
jgi:hypothetical protein